MPGDRRDQLIDTAARLFYRDGYHATGIDKILAEARVAKMTLYKHFKSKDELILAALHREDERFRNWFMRAVERRGRTPAERLVAIFDAMEERFNQPEWVGCPFINASAEYSERGNPIRTVAAESKRLVLGYIRELAASAGAHDPEALACQLMVLMEGSIVVTQLTNNADAVRQARNAAQVLVNRATEV